jgi:hypothetical protein
VVGAFARTTHSDHRGGRKSSATQRVVGAEGVAAPSGRPEITTINAVGTTKRMWDPTAFPLTNDGYTIPHSSRSMP